MKRIYPALGAALAALLLAACQLPGALGVGSLKIAVPAPAGLRAATNPTGQGSLIRIQLVRNGVVVPLSSQNILQQTMAGQTITIDSLATGTNYKIYAASGSMNTQGTGFFETSYFAASDPFEISAGTSTSVSMTLKPTPVSIIEGGGTNVNHAAVSYNNALYFINGPDFKYVSGADPASGTQQSQISSYLTSANAAGATVYSVSNGFASGTFWFNTDKGILRSSGNALQSATASPMRTSASTNVSPIPVVWTSGAITLTGASKGYLAIYFGPGLNAGLAPSSTVTGAFNSGDPYWTTLTTALGLNQGSTLQTSLNNLKQAISGVATDGANYIYLATGIGTYRLTAPLLAQDATALGTNMTNGTDAQGNSILLQTEDGALIGPVSTYAGAASKAFAFAGTARGLYASTIDASSGKPTGGDGKLSLLTETTGLNITSLQTLPYVSATGAPNTAYTVAYSATTNELLIYNDLSLVTRLPALVGLPSGNLQLTWHAYKDTASLNHLLLVATGSDATVEYPVTTW